MSAPYSSGSDSIGMADLELGKKEPSVTVTSLSVDSPQRPVLGRRRTTPMIDGPQEHKLSYNGEEDTLTKVGNYLWK